MSDITRYRGDTYADEFVIKSKATGLPINIAGYTFLLTVDPEKAPVSDTNNLFSIVGTIVDAPTGRVEFAPSAPQADRVGSFFYDVQMIDGAGRKRTVVMAKYKFVQDITKV
jgi:hypothetical protein